MPQGKNREFLEDPNETHLDLTKLLNSYKTTETVEEEITSESSIAEPEVTQLSNESVDSPTDFTFKSEYTGLEIFENTITSIPYLWEPFLQKVGLAALVGESDCGKSTFLSYLTLHIALGKNSFLDGTLHTKHKKAIYVSTEDDIFSVSPKIKNQLKSLKGFKKKDLKNIEFIFDSNNLLANLEKKLKQHPRDLIIIDAFGDIFSDDLNQNNKVRSFLDKYQSLAKKYECLIIFLHHIKKNSGNYTSKDNVIGSQGFEAKMRVVLQLRPMKNGDISLLVLKGNFIKREIKQKALMYQLMQDQSFHNTGITSSINSVPKKNNDEIIEKVISLSTAYRDGTTNKFHSVRDIVDQLKDTKLEVKRNVVGAIVKQNRTKIDSMREKLNSVKKRV